QKREKDLALSGAQPAGEPVSADPSARDQRDEASGEPDDPSSDSPAPRKATNSLLRSPGVWTAVVAILLIVFAATFASRCDREAVTGEPPSGSTPEFLHPPERAEEAHQTEVSGVVVRELPLEED